MLNKTLFPRDEELGKRDDDLKPRRPAGWRSTMKAPLRWRRRRILLTMVGLYLCYLLWRNMSSRTAADGPPPYSPQHLPIADTTQAESAEPSGAPPAMKVTKQDAPVPNSYNGPIRFYRLAASLQEARSSLTYRSTLRNVLFSISNLKSASTLIPVACEMAKRNRNTVHIAVMGRDAISLDALREINGVDKKSCPAKWHDARPDYSEYSTESRAEACVASALKHINDYVSPQVTIVDGSRQEDPFFLRGIHKRAKLLDIPVIEIPLDGSDRMMWITRLDAQSLKAWNKPNVEIVIQAPTHSSGSLIRLLKSIQQADYTGMRVPRLTIELPAEVDPPTKRHLESYHWPPINDDNTQGSSQLVIRRRIANDRLSQEESSIRFLELFYPANTADDHVLLLSPNTELSPLYYHYLTYAVLEYKYALYVGLNVDSLMGLSLHLPTTLLDGKSALDILRIPVTDMLPNTKSKDISPVNFLWQAPNSHAALYFGDKWATLHSFLSNRVRKQHQGLSKSSRSKLISETLPAWTEYMLELMRARGFFLMYPATTSSDSLVTIHNELYHIPEEFARESDNAVDKEATTVPKSAAEAFLTGEEPPTIPESQEPSLVPYSRPLHLALPFDAQLPEIYRLPYLTYSGKGLPQENISETAAAYANFFRREIGGCPPLPKGRHRKIEPTSARDLFCFGDETEDHFIDDVVPSDTDWDPFGLNTPSLAVTSTASETVAKVTAPAEPRER